MGGRKDLWEFDGGKYTTDGEKIYFDKIDKLIKETMPPGLDLKIPEDAQIVKRSVEEVFLEPDGVVNMRPRPGRSEDISKVVKKYIKQGKGGQE